MTAADKHFPQANSDNSTTPKITRPAAKETKTIHLLQVLMCRSKDCVVI
jgi:hypothetical protein